MVTRRFFSGVSDFTFPDIRRMLTLDNMSVIRDGLDRITAGDVYGVRIAPELVTNAITGEVSRRYEKGMAEDGFLLHGNRNPSRAVSDE